MGIRKELESVAKGLSYKEFSEVIVGGTSGGLYDDMVNKLKKLMDENFDAFLAGTGPLVRESLHEKVKELHEKQSQIEALEHIHDADELDVMIKAAIEQRDVPIIFSGLSHDEIAGKLERINIGSLSNYAKQQYMSHNLVTIDHAVNRGIDIEFLDHIGLEDTSEWEYEMAFAKVMLVKDDVGQWLSAAVERKNQLENPSMKP